MACSSKTRHGVGGKNPEKSTPILTTTNSLLHASQSGPKRLSFKRAAAMTAFTGSTLISDFRRQNGWTDGQMKMCRKKTLIDTNT